MEKGFEGGMIRFKLVFKRFRRCGALGVAAVLVFCVIVINLLSAHTNNGILTSPWRFMNNGSAQPDVTSRVFRKRTPVRHVVFVKVHKAASTTLMNIFVRFSVSHNLTLMLPRWKNIINEHGNFNGANVLPAIKSKTYDILCNHVIFNKTAITPFFPADTKYVGILRDPFDLLVSAFMYYRYVYPMPYLWKITGKNPVSTYLEDPSKYEPQNQSLSFTNNRMAVDLGYPNVSIHNLTEAELFISELDKTFDLMLISEYFDESVILLKRKFNWDLQDVLYIASNSQAKGRELQFTPRDRSRHEKWAWLDYMLYNHFYKVFWDRVHEQGRDFYSEVQTFKRVRHLWQTFCSQKLKSTDTLHIEASDWSSAFDVTADECYLAVTKEIPLMDFIRRKHITRMRANGISMPRTIPLIMALKNKYAAKSANSGHHVTGSKHHPIETKSSRNMVVNSTKSKFIPLHRPPPRLLGHVTKT